MSSSPTSPTGRKSFLELLHASDGGFLEQELQESRPRDRSDTVVSIDNLQPNEETIRASNVGTNHHYSQSKSSLIDLFLPPGSGSATVAPPGTGSATVAPPSIESMTKMYQQQQQQQQTNDDGDLLRGERIALDDEQGTSGSPERPGPLPTSSALSPWSKKRDNNDNPSFSLHQPSMRFPPRPPAIGHRDRAVSFDTEAIQKDHEQKQQLQQLQQQRDAANGAGGVRMFNLDDLLTSDPYELEAETNILKALEEQPSHRRFRSETSTILSYVPENMSHDFSVEGDNAEVDKMESLYGGEPALIEQAPSHGRGHSTAEAEERDIEQSIPLMKATKKGHRRSLSVEDRLSGLATEMSLLRKQPTTAELRAERRPLNNASSADNFLHNTLLVSDDGSLPAKLKASEVSNTLSRVEEGDDEEASTTSSDDSNPNGGSVGDKTRKSRRSHLLSSAADTLKDDWEIWSSFFNPRKEHIVAYSKILVLYFGIPFLAVSAILFYAFDNPPTGKSPDGSPGSRASASWWLLFVVRQSVTLSTALLLQMIIVDFLSISTRLMLRIVGPILTLLIVQSKGWPFVCFFWSLLDFGLLHGDNYVARHWLYWQEPVQLFNAKNPSGQVVDNPVNTEILLIICCVSLAVSVKRFVVGLFLSRNTFNHYGESLAKVMSKMVIISQVAQLAKRMERSRKSSAKSKAMSVEETLARTGALKQIYSSNDLEGEDRSVDDSSVKSEVTDTRSVHTKVAEAAAVLDDTNKMKLLQLLGEWEEPDSRGLGIPDSVTISAVLRFRNALNLINKDNSFSLAFGPTHSREACIESSQNVYSRLLQVNPQDEHVHFETLALTAIDTDGNIDEDKARELVKVFRPRRDGILTMLDFIKSVDSVYKELRLLDASIENSSQIDRAFENLINVIFYAIILTVILHFLGFNPLAFFLSLTSVVLAFAFMIGSASSKYFEGILFILVRRPYDIGDIVHFSRPDEPDNPNGSIGWIIQRVTLFETVGTWVPTLERASFNNGSLASSQIINWARSPNARINVQLNFPIETKYEQIEVFKRAIEEFIRIRPREWLALSGFRCNRIYTEQSYMNVTLLLQHREPWQSVGQILDSKANLVTYCNEVQKKLGMVYRAPPLPVHLKGVASQFLENSSSSGSVAAGSGGGTAEGASAAVVPNTNTSADDSESAEAKMNHFRLIAKTQHQIRSG